MYSVQFEIAGPVAMWRDPTTGNAPVSYPAPTCSASKGMFENILMLENATVCPAKVEICKPLRYQSFAFNYSGPLRKTNLIKEGNKFQQYTTVLADVCYRLYAIIKDRATDNYTNNNNGKHAYQQIFYRRLKKGQFFHMLFLGWKEFCPTYVGEFRDETETCEEINTVLPNMLISPFEPVYKQNAKIKKGVLCYD